MAALFELRSILPDIQRGRDLLARITRIHDTPEPVSGWRPIPDQVQILDPDDRRGFVETLLPLIRPRRQMRRTGLRRFYQLCTLIDLPRSDRRELILALYTRDRLIPDQFPAFGSLAVRTALIDEAGALAGRAPSRETHEYVASLKSFYGIDATRERRWTVLLEHLTNLENRVAAILGKRGHIVRVEDRKLEIFKKAVAGIGVPAAVLFPLGTVGLSMEGISTGLIALGGGFLLPASVAAISGLGIAVALGISTKKILDLVMPTTDADRFSIDSEKLHSGSAKIEEILTDAASREHDRLATEKAREQIATIIRQILPITDHDRAKIAASLEHSKRLGRRYLDSLAEDLDELKAPHLIGAEDLENLLTADTPVISGHASF